MSTIKMCPINISIKLITFLVMYGDQHPTRPGFEPWANESSGPDEPKPRYPASIQTMLTQWWGGVADGGPTLSQHSVYRLPSWKEFRPSLLFFMKNSANPNEILLIDLDGFPITGGCLRFFPRRLPHTWDACCNLIQLYASRATKAVWRGGMAWQTSGIYPRGRRSCLSPLRAWHVRWQMAKRDV